MKRIYVAGPLTALTRGAVQDNVDRAILVGQQIDSMGGNAFVPHLFTRWDEVYPGDYERWMAKCLDELARCDAMYLIAPSPGALREKDFAISKGIPVYVDLLKMIAEEL